MDPQSENNPIITNNPISQLNTNTVNNLTVISMAMFVLLALAAVGFLYYQNQQLKQMLASYQQTPTPFPLASVSPTPNTDLPNVTSPLANVKVTSPLKITGLVPTGWMFEGVFPIKLVDANRKVISQGQAKETAPGSWQDTKPVNFTATLTFKTTSETGFIILENDNPSGIPSNSKTFEIPVKFLEAPTASPTASPKPSSIPLPY